MRNDMGARFHAWLMSHAGPRYDALTAERKRVLLGGLRGKILEIGPGTGPNLRYYSRDNIWTGVEPNVHMDRHLARAIMDAGVVADLRHGYAERLPVEDASQDAVVSTLVLCSVANPEQVLNEIRRVLKPGGQFVFLEHVAAPLGTRLRKVQRWLRPIEMWIGNGCHPDRETWQAIEDAGFARVEIEHFRLPLAHVAPQIAGRAIK
ncbi:MAG: SAM-dependent methyltransferase [Acidobacteria bacterium]|nr:SAM-dependent methyltransferase [Acidobacteriota bacterium]